MGANIGVSMSLNENSVAGRFSSTTKWICNWRLLDVIIGFNCFNLIACNCKGYNNNNVVFSSNWLMIFL